MSDYQPGEVVDITIRGARVMKTWPHATTGTWLSVNYERTTADISLLLPADAITVERVVPAEWPPQPGDLWRDRHGGLWFIHGHPGNTLKGRTADGHRWTHDAVAELRDACGPLTLVHREVAS